MTDDQGLRVIGLICLVIGVVCAIWGDKQLPTSGPFSSRFSSFSRQFQKYKWLKWAMGGSLVYAGLSFLFHT